MAASSAEQQADRGFEADSYREHAGGAALFSHDAEIMGWLFR